MYLYTHCVCPLGHSAWIGFGLFAAETIFFLVIKSLERSVEETFYQTVRDKKRDKNEKVANDEFTIKLVTNHLQILHTIRIRFHFVSG